MTSAVTIKAHCGKTKHVRVIITNPDATPTKEEFFLNDGESKEVSVYDRRTLHTMEEDKPVEQEKEKEAKPKGSKKSTAAATESTDPDAGPSTGPDAGPSTDEASDPAATSGDAGGNASGDE